MTRPVPDTKGGTLAGANRRRLARAVSAWSNRCVGQLQLALLIWPMARRAGWAPAQPAQLRLLAEVSVGFGGHGGAGVVEHAVQAFAEGGGAGDDQAAQNSDDQSIFSGRSARLVELQVLEDLHH